MYVFTSFSGKTLLGAFILFVIIAIVWVIFSTLRSASEKVRMSQMTPEDRKVEQARINKRKSDSGSRNLGVQTTDEMYAEIIGDIQHEERMRQIEEMSTRGCPYCVSRISREASVCPVCLRDIVPAMVLPAADDRQPTA